jgi:hypothetical protein
MNIELSSLTGALETAQAGYKRFGLSMVPALNEIGRRCVAKLQSTTSERRPPARRGEAARYAHPGHWADVTGTLAKNYYYEVTASFPPSLVVGNRDPGGYGAILELREGFFVIRGIDDPGGLIEQTLREVMVEMGIAQVTRA